MRTARSASVLTCIAFGCIAVVMGAACNGVLGIDKRSALPDDDVVPDANVVPDGAVQPLADADSIDASVSNPNFSLTASPPKLSLQPGKSAQISVSVVRQAGFTGRVLVSLP